MQPRNHNRIRPALIYRRQRQQQQQHSEGGTGAAESGGADDREEERNVRRRVDNTEAEARARAREEAQRGLEVCACLPRGLIPCSSEGRPRSLRQ